VLVDIGRATWEPLGIRPHMNDVWLNDENLRNAILPVPVFDRVDTTIERS
jgi:hypothetical protein